MTAATARRELRSDLTKGMCGTCFVRLASTQVRRSDHKPGCKLINDAALPRRKGNT